MTYIYNLYVGFNIPAIGEKLCCRILFNYRLILAYLMRGKILTINYILPVLVSR